MTSFHPNYKIRRANAIVPILQMKKLKSQNDVCIST